MSSKRSQGGGKPPAPASGASAPSGSATPGSASTGRRTSGFGEPRHGDSGSGGFGRGRGFLSPGRSGLYLFLLAAALGLAFSLALLIHARHVNGRDGFPLDDPWIHLTYARNLHDHHRFTYFPGDASTQGSTSPLYTILLSLGFTFTRDEKGLSYVLGTLFQVLFLAALGAWARARLGSALWAAAAVLLVGLDARIGILSVSGMETSLFLFLLALGLYAQTTRRRALAGLAAGLAVWVRPDGLILALLLVLDLLWERMSRGGSPGHDRGASGETGAAAPVRWIDRPWVRLLLPAAGLIVAYFLFNLALGGTLLPNTFAAKTAYYRATPRSIFLKTDVAGTFGFGGWIVLVPFCLGWIVREAVRLARGVSGVWIVEAGWVLALPLSYYFMLPFGHRFERYLVPALPALAVLGLAAIRRLAFWAAAGRGKARGREARGAAHASRGLGSGLSWSSPAGILAAVLVLAALVLQGRGAAEASSQYQQLCQYHYVRHERTAQWLAANTPSDAVIATHDVGAIAYYSGRKVIDIVGVVLPEAVVHLHSPGYAKYLIDLFERARVTHLVLFRDWLEVVNVQPLFTADPRPEIMEVFPWIPARTHLTAEDASAHNAQAAAFLRVGQFDRALEHLQESLRIDDKSSRTWMLYGNALELSRRPQDAEAAYLNAIALFPEFAEARFRHAVVLAGLGRMDEARSDLKTLLAQKPDFPGAAAMLEQISR